MAWGCWKQQIQEFAQLGHVPHARSEGENLRLLAGATAASEPEKPEQSAQAESNPGFVAPYCAILQYYRCDNPGSLSLKSSTRRPRKLLTLFSCLSISLWHFLKHVHRTFLNVHISFAEAIDCALGSGPKACPILHCIPENPGQVAVGVSLCVCVCASAKNAGFSSKSSAASANEPCWVIKGIQFGLVEKGWFLQGIQRGLFEECWFLQGIQRSLFEECWFLLGIQCSIC